MNANPRSPDFRLSDSPLYLLIRAAGSYEPAMEKFLREIGMDVPSWRALMIVQERNPCGVSEIAETSVSPRSTMTRVMQRLEMPRLVQLAQSRSDARVTDVFITAEGTRAAQSVREVAARIYLTTRGDRSAVEIEELTRTLKGIYENLSSNA